MIEPSKYRQSGRHGLLIVAGAAFAVRLLYLWYYAGLPEWSMLTVDNWYHHNWAVLLAGGDLLGDTTYFRAPFYVWCLGLLYAVFGSSVWVGRLFGLVIGLGSVYLTGRIGQKLFSTRVGIVAAALHAVYPIAIYFEQELLLDPLFTFLVELTVLRFLHWWEQPTPLRMGTVGLLLGLAAITRPTALVFVPVVLAVMLVHKESRLRLRQLALLAAGLVVVIAPITIRNLVVGGEPVLIASQAGINLYIGNNNSADGKSAILPQPFGYNWQLADIVYEAEQAEGRSLTPGEVSSFWTDRALAWMLEHPAVFLSLYVKKIAYFFSSDEPSNNRNITQYFSRVPFLGYNPLSFGILLTLAVLGVVAHWRDNRPLRALVAAGVVYILVTALFFVNARFRLPLLPIFFVTAAAGVLALGTWLKWNPSRALPTLLLALVVGLFSYLGLVGAPRAIPTTSLMQGKYSFERGEYDAALQSFRQAQAVNPHYAEVNLNLGAVFFRQGIADSAEIYFEREIANHPHRVKGYTNLASLYLVSGRIERARVLATDGLAARPFDQMAWLVLIRAVAQSPDSIQAMLPELADGAAEATDANVYVLNELGAALSQGGSIAKAQEVLQRAAEASPPPIEMNDDMFTREFATGPLAWQKEQGASFYQLGYLAGIQGRFGEALGLTETALERDSGLIPAWINLANAYRATGQPGRADSVLQRAFERFGADQIQQFLPR